MIQLIVYVDVLIFLNTVVDYFLLSATGRITGERPSDLRMILASVLGGISSLYIFLPQSKVILELLFKIAVSFIITAVCFYFSSVKRFIKNALVLFAVTCGYCGIMFALWLTFKPNGMVINNSVVYINISPLFLVLFSVAGYFIFSLLYKIFKKTGELSEKCKITVTADGKEIILNAMVDTGNSVEDVFGLSDVIIADKSAVTELFGSFEAVKGGKYASRYRILPLNTVTGTGTVEGFRCEKATVETKRKKAKLYKPILAISKTPLKDGCNAIINPKILR